MLFFGLEREKVMEAKPWRTHQPHCWAGTHLNVAVDLDVDLDTRRLEQEHPLKTRDHE